MKKIIYIVLVILFYSCSDDDLLNEQISSAQPASTIIPITKAKYSYDTQKNNLFIQQKAPKFYQRFSPKSADASSITLSWGTIKTDEALEVQEVNGYTTTTYKIEPYEIQDDELYNLVFITKDTLVSAHVYGYKMDETFKTNYHENGESLANFSGQIVSQEIIKEDRVSNIDCVEFINDLLNNQDGGSTGGGGSGGGTSPGGGSPSGGGSTAGATDWFDSVPVFEDQAPSTSDPIDWSWVGDVGGAIVDAGGNVGQWASNTLFTIGRWLGSFFCGCKSLTQGNDYKEVVYVVIDLDEEHDCYPLAIGIIGDTLSPEYIEGLFGMSMENFENVRDNHPQLFVDMMDVIMQGDFNANRISLFRNLSLALLDDSVSEENIANILLFLDDNNTDEGVAFALELLDIVEENPHTNTNFTTSDYPGIEDGFPYEWWKDDDFILNNMLVPTEQPNVVELLLFSLFPAVAIAHIENSQVALDRAYELCADLTLCGEGLNGIQDGKADAFRHAFWNALGTAEFGKYIMKLFADAHEWNKDGLDVEMDLFNNQIGRNIGEGFTFSSSNEIIEFVVLEALYNGELVYIYNNTLVLTNQ